MSAQIIKIFTGFYSSQQLEKEYSTLNSDKEKMPFALALLDQMEKARKNNELTANQMNQYDNLKNYVSSKLFHQKFFGEKLESIYTGLYKIWYYLVTDSMNNYELLKKLSFHVDYPLCRILRFRLNLKIVHDTIKSNKTEAKEYFEDLKEIAKSDQLINEIFSKDMNKLEAILNS